MIHYHGTPCGATRKDVVQFLSGRHALISFVRPEDINAAAVVCQSFILDNGAFSAWKKNKPITCWREYYDWVLAWRKHPAFDFAIIPDVIAGTERQNDDLILEWSRTMHRGAEYGAPVWHLHESIERLKRLSDNWRVVCLGSSGEFAQPKTKPWWGRIRDAISAICDQHGRPQCKLHGLRMLDPAIFSRLPLASADSTNAVRNSSSFRRFGMYCPPTAAQRMEVIASRIESRQSISAMTRDRQMLLGTGNDSQG